MTARDALHAAVQGGAKNLGRDDIGQIAPGYAADLIAFRTDKLAFAGAQHDLIAALVFCSPGADQVTSYSIIYYHPSMVGSRGANTVCNRAPLTLHYLEGLAPVNHNFGMI